MFMTSFFFSFLLLKLYYGRFATHTSQSVKKCILNNLWLHFTLTRKSSCVTARGVLPAPPPLGSISRTWEVPPYVKPPAPDLGQGPPPKWTWHWTRTPHCPPTRLGTGPAPPPPTPQSVLTPDQAPLGPVDIWWQNLELQGQAPLWTDKLKTLPSPYYVCGR